VISDAGFDSRASPLAVRRVTQLRRHVVAIVVVEVVPVVMVVDVVLVVATATIVAGTREALPIVVPPAPGQR